jgi:hypothetical protein
VPQTVAAGQQRVTEGQLVDAPQADRRVALRAQATRQQVGLRVRVGCFLGQLALVDQTLHEGMVSRAAHHVGTTEVVHARIASVCDPGFEVGVDQERRHRAVGLFLGRDGGELDHQVRFHHQLVQKL